MSKLRASNSRASKCRAVWVAVFFLSGLAACTKSAKTGDEPVKPGSATVKKRSSGSDIAGAGKVTPMDEQGKPAGGQPASPAPAAGVTETCKPFGPATGMMPEPPVVVPGKPIVLTRFIKTCTTRDGQKGFEQESPWLAMGFPCTGGSGKVDIKGTHYNSPKMVSFILGTDCTMNPVSKDAAAAAVAQILPLPIKAPLAAYTPFVLQYWEVVGMQDADVGFSIDLRSAPALEGAWKKVRENGAMRVLLFGRENAWVAGDNFYQAEGDLRLTGRSSFRLDVVSVKSLPREEVDKVKLRCEALRPARNCSAVFQ